MDKQALENLKNKLRMAQALQKTARKEITLSESQAKVLAEAIKRILRAC